MKVFINELLNNSSLFETKQSLREDLDYYTGCYFSDEVIDNIWDDLKSGLITDDDVRKIAFGAFLERQLHPDVNGGRFFYDLYRKEVAANAWKMK